MMSQADILIVDDEADIVSMLSEMLSDEGYNVRGARDGFAALREVAQRPPALVLLDYSMPGMSGAELAAKIRANGHAVPLVLMSAGTRLDAVHIPGIDAMLPKPFDFDRLLNTVERYVRDCKAQATVAPTFGVTLSMPQRLLS